MTTTAEVAPLTCRTVFRHLVNIARGDPSPKVLSDRARVTLVGGTQWNPVLSITASLRLHLQESSARARASAGVSGNVITSFGPPVTDPRQRQGLPQQLSPRVV